jgi:hypothetical protein
MCLRSSAADESLDQHRFLLVIPELGKKLIAQKHSEFPERPSGPVIAKWQLKSSKCKGLCRFSKKTSCTKGLSPMELSSRPEA